jgi:hypothetical protein
VLWVFGILRYLSSKSIHSNQHSQASCWGVFMISRAHQLLILKSRNCKCCWKATHIGQGVHLLAKSAIADHSLDSPSVLQFSENYHCRHLVFTMQSIMDHFDCGRYEFI